MRKSFRRRGFTLIELLIVVAIIAILAAIAVPNFLEAQVRAKVSRAKADMRSLATAIEAYHVDHNLHPIAEQWVLGLIPNTFNNRLRGITTPVSYVSSLPLDVFWNGVIQFPITPGQPPTFEYEDWTTAVVGQAKIFSGFNLFETMEAYETYYGGGPVLWSLHSPGPDRTNDFQEIGAPGGSSFPLSVSEASIEGITRIYDPTNGTVSTGDVVRTSKEQRN